MDYLDVIAHYPLYAFHFAVSVWGGVVVLPWPPLREFFGSLVIFVGLYPVRAVMKALLPEEKVARKLYRRKKTVPSPHEHQSAAAAISSIFH